MRNKIIASLRFFDGYVASVRRSGYKFLEMPDLPTLHDDAKATVSDFLGKPSLDLDYRDSAAFEADVASIREWLNHIDGKHVVKDICTSWIFEEEEFSIHLRLWTIK